MLRRFLMLLVLTIIACQPEASIATSPSPGTTSFPTETSIPQPTATETLTPIPTVPVSSVELKGAEVPQGFSLIKFADLYRPTAFAFDAQGRMFVTSQDGNVYLLRDEDKDGRANSRATFSSGYYFPLGVTVHIPTGDVYVSHQGKITVLSDTNGDDKADVEKIFAGDLPFDLHQNDNLKFGPDGWLCIGVGSTCNACDDIDRRSASILRFNIDTGESEVYTIGLRNPFDLAFHPESSELFATDNGRDDLGMDAPFEEVKNSL